MAAALTLLHRRHRPFLIGALVAVLALGIGLVTLDTRLAIELAAVLFFVTYLVLAALRIPRLDGPYLRDNAAGTDEPAIVIFLVTVAAVVVSLGALFQVLNEQKGAPMIERILAFSAVASGWLTVHTMAAFHYAHRYWSPDMLADRPEGEEGTKADTPNRGLDFPSTPLPGIVDFLYFSFVIGMTAQTSDVAICSTAMRRVNLVHAIVSFFFNAVLVAVAVNAAVALL
jgi:uncharacterized membrane protein